MWLRLIIIVSGLFFGTVSMAQDIAATNYWVDPDQGCSFNKGDTSKVNNYTVCIQTCGVKVTFHFWNKAGTIADYDCPTVQSCCSYTVCYKVQEAGNFTFEAVANKGGNSSRRWCLAIPPDSAVPGEGSTCVSIDTNARWVGTDPKMDREYAYCDKPS